MSPTNEDDLRIGDRVTWRADGGETLIGIVVAKLGSGRLLVRFLQPRCVSSVHSDHIEVSVVQLVANDSGEAD